ncbi:hypothetical protein [uncultured Shewanella sp.]|uniref:hypothetical protein n=1 Tax=uncultured Shewanella sp. TaxID=173975 RepID=UPI002613C64A|nr:hypothetical protein [uncultured Shewanella sp.]
MSKLKNKGLNFDGIIVFGYVLFIEEKMRLLKGIVLGMGALLSGQLLASDAINQGSISDVAYRDGFVTLRVIGSDGDTNHCDKCPSDPGGISTSKCWIEESKTAQISMLLSAQARGKKITGRVHDIAKDCTLYQMTLQD